VSADVLGAELAAFVARLYPICRSITGDGVRETLRVLSEVVPLQVHEVPSGTAVLDWTVPDEWNCREAWIADAQGRRVVDFRDSNLHVVSYSQPVRARMTLAELRPHLHALPDRPDWIPYRTSYYDAAWGFCLSQRALDALPDGSYDVCIDATLAPGHLTYGEAVVPGTTDDEVLVSAHCCHPSLADDNLSGLAVSAALARHLARTGPRRHTYRFLYAPGTIGALTWLARNRERVLRIRHGLTLTCLGDERPFTYKKTLAGDAAIDRAAALVLRDRGAVHHLIPFFPYGYDERQYNAPGFRLPVGSLMRGRHGQFPEYHTSADDLSFVSGARLAESLSVLCDLVDVLEQNRTFRNLQPYGEPQLGRRGLYRAVGGGSVPGVELAMLWVLNLSDGRHALLDVAERSGLEFRAVAAAARALEEHGLLAEVAPEV
jgi:aminopeptidase-like protein